MKRDVRAPVIRLLTERQAADHLGLTASDVGRLVLTGDLLALRVSPHGGRRFWPADVDAYASGGPRRRTESGSALDAIRPAIGTGSSDATATGTKAQPVTMPQPPHRALTRLEATSRRPTWPRFEAIIERVAPGYLSFRDAEHVTRYVEARASLEIEASRSVEEHVKA
jgi:hypothetical protein